jgi:DNA replication protein DnaC
MTVQSMTPEPSERSNLEALSAILRAMRLGGVAEELPDLLAEAAREGWGQIDLLCELFQREALRKRQRRFERNLKASGLTDCFGLEHFDFDIGRDHGLAPSVVRDLAQCEFVRARRNVILAGGVGTGKTFLAKTLGVEALKRGFKVLSFNTADLVDLLYAKRNSFQFGKVYGRVRDVDLILLDDLAYMPYSVEKVEFLFSLVVDRYELKPGSMIVTSNTDVTEWWRFFPSKAMGMAFSDRLLDGAQGIELTGESIRQRRTKDMDSPEKKKPEGKG